MSHALKYNGAPYAIQAGRGNGPKLVHEDSSTTSGVGHALCACGELSPELPTGKARREWFKEHKLETLTADVAAGEEALQATELVQGQDVLAGTPEDEVAEALAELVEAPAPKVSRRRKAEQAAGFLPEVDAHPTTASLAALLPGVGGKPARKAKETPGVDDAASERNAHKHTLPFTKAITPGFWRSLGRKATTTMVDELFPTVVVSANNNTRKLTFQGPKDDVEAAVAATKEMWAEALQAVVEWKKTDEGFLGRSTEPLARRREGYHLTERFFEGFGSTYAEWVKSH